MVGNFLGRLPDWRIQPWIYPPGTALSLHSDGGRYAGALTFFFHQQWKLHWGGWLVVMNSEANVSGSLSVPVFDDDLEAAAIADPGLGRMIMPLPNRLVVLAGSALHLVSRVDPTAGDRSRLSVGGFFLRPGQSEPTT